MIIKLVRFNGNRIGLLEEGVIHDITDREGFDPCAWPPVSAVTTIARYCENPDTLLRDAGTLPRIALADARLQCPVDWPNKVIAFPANYHAHIDEARTAPFGLISAFPANAQGFFLKANSSLSGPADAIQLPAVSREIHHECELAVIIGKGGRHIAVEDALEHVFGYSALIDMVVRGREERVMRKSFDTFCPLGPWITLARDVPNPSDIDIRLTVNGEERQRANTRDLIVPIPHMIAMASAVVTLFPGDVIATGTPAGVGPVRDGDRIVSEVVGVATLSLDVVQTIEGDHPVWNKQA